LKIIRIGNFSFELKKGITRFFAVCAVLSLLVHAACIWTVMGKSPGKEYKEKFASSVNYHPDKEVFENRIPDLMEKMNERVYTWNNISEWFKSGIDREPECSLPEIRPDIAEFTKPSNDLKVIWFGHSSLLLNINGVVVLIDPVFSKSASPFGFIVKRFQPAVLQPKDLPKIDYILISHDHYDHLDMKTIEFFKDKKSRFITPLGVGSHLKSWGISGERITEKDWWETAKFNGIEFIAAPAQHFSGRNGIRQNTTLWASWIIRSKNSNIYFSGDSGYDIHFKEIGERYGPFDIAFLESGQYNKTWKEVHMMPEEAVLAFYDLKAKKYFPIHWGMFSLSFHSWYDPVERLNLMSEKKKFELIVPKLGQIVNIKRYRTQENWTPGKVQTASLSADRCKAM